MATRQDWLNANEGDQVMATEAENAILSIGRDMLPACAIDVLDRRVEDPAPEYWSFLISQIET